MHMKKIREARLGLWVLAGVMTLVLMLMLGLFVERFSIVSHAESQGKVTANSANIRKEPNASSEVLGSTIKDKPISIKSQTTGGDGNVWYQVFVDSDTLGYIRSDLVSITDGTTPPTEAASSTTTVITPTPTQAPAVNETPVEVAAVQPISANVTGGQKVRIRANASTTSQVVTTAEDGVALTVTGQANGTDGKVWYQVTFIANGSEVTGFIRSDYVTLSGELTPAGEEPPQEGGGEQQPEEPPAPQESKDWDTQLQGEEWYLINNVEAKQYLIQDLFDGVQKNADLYMASEKKVKSQKTVIIILVVLLVLLGAGVAYLIFKIKDMMDSAYFSEVERETIRRNGDRSQGGSGQKVMHTVGTQKQGGTRPAGTRPAGGGTPAQGGTRPAGARPAGARPAGGGTPAQGGTRPAGARPAGSGTPAQGGTRPAGTRPAGSGAPAQGGARPAGARPGGVRPAGGPVQGKRPAQGETIQEGRGNGPKQAAPRQQAGSAQNPGWKSKNFMADDDEFEFEFLNWDGDEEQ